MKRAILIMSVVELVLAVICVVGLASVLFQSGTLDLVTSLAFLLANPVFVLSIAPAVLVLIDAAERQRRGWFVALLVLLLIMTLPAGTIALINTVIGDVNPFAHRLEVPQFLLSLVELGLAPMAIALAGLVYAFRSGADRAAPARRGGALRRATLILAIVALVMVGPLTLITVFTIAGGDINLIIPANSPVDRLLVWLIEASDLITQLPFVVSLGVLVMVQASRQQRRGWLTLMIVLTLLGVLLAGFFGTLDSLGFISPPLRGQLLTVRLNSLQIVSWATTLAAAAVPLAALVYTFHAPRKSSAITPHGASE